MPTCTNCPHSRSAHVVDTNNKMVCQLCDCTQPFYPASVSIREAARRYAAERGCGREKVVAQLSDDENLLLHRLFSSALDGKPASLTAFERLNFNMDVEALAQKLGVDL